MNSHTIIFPPFDHPRSRIARSESAKSIEGDSFRSFKVVMSTDDSQSSVPPEASPQERDVIRTLESIVHGTSFVRVNAAFIELVKESVNYRESVSILRGGTIPITPLVNADPKSALSVGANKAASNVRSWIDALRKKGADVDSAISSPAMRRTLLNEVVRYGYGRELSSAFSPPREFWTGKISLVREAASKFGVRNVERSTLWSEYLFAIHEKAKRMRSKQMEREAMMKRIATSPDPKAAAAEAAEAKKKAILAKKQSLEHMKKRKSLINAYIKIGAISNLSDSSDMQEFIITAHAYLAYASVALEPSYLIRMEEGIVNIVARVKAGFVMNEEMMQQFMKQMEPIAEQLRQSSGTIIVHRPEGVDSSKVDAAVKDFISHHGEDMEERVAVWNPDIAERMRADRSNHC